MTPAGHRKSSSASPSENRWPITWLNNQAAGYLARTPGEGDRVYDHPHLQVNVTPPDHLLAMKTLAARATRDADDIAVLLDHLQISTAAEVWLNVERFFPEAPIPERSVGLIKDLISERRAPR